MSESKRKLPWFHILLPSAVIVLCGAGYLSQYGGADSSAAPSAGTAESRMQSADSDDLQDALTSIHAQAGSRIPHATQRYDRRVADPRQALQQLHQGMTAAPNMRAKREQLLVQLEQQHQSEPVDAAWSTKVETKALAAVDSPVMARAGLKPRDMSLDCRASTCRIAASFKDPGEAQDWAERYLPQMGGSLSQVKMLMVPQPDGTVEVRMYGRRT